MSENPGRDGENDERKPWPIRYVIVSIVIFIICFNLYLLLTS